MSQRSLIAVSATATMVLVAPVDAGITGTAVELVEPQAWLDNGYDAAALDTYRLYLEFDDPADQLLAVFGAAEHALSVESSDGTFINADPIDSLTAPVDLTAGNFWLNQWDTYLTIDTTSATGDATTLSVSFGDEVNDLQTSFATTAAAWFITPTDVPQGLADGGRVLIAQLTVNEGTSVSGIVNAQIAGGTSFTDLEFGSVIPGAGGLGGLGLVILHRSRRRERKAHP